MDGVLQVPVSMPRKYPEPISPISAWLNPSNVARRGTSVETMPLPAMRMNTAASSGITAT